MSPAKGDSSSSRKGKKVSTDDSPAETMGDKAPHSESEPFEEEEGGHEPGSEHPPLIDQWYDTHIHFLIVPGDYLPPPSSHVWLSICRHDIKVSWTPLASSIPDLDVHQGTSLLVPILFEFGSSTSLSWKEWVDTKLSNMGFMAALQQASVLKAIVSSRCLSNYRDLFNLRPLVCRWCSATHTFLISCGKITVTLKDMANQLLLPILSDTDPNDIELSTEEEVMEVELKKGISGNAKLSHWVGVFSKASIAICHAAFVTFWLCKFIFSSHPIML